MGKKYNQMPVEDQESFRRELQHLKNTADELRSMVENMRGRPDDGNRLQEIAYCALADASTEYDRKAKQFINLFNVELKDIKRKNKGA